MSPIDERLKSLNIVAVLKAAVGDLGCVRRIVKLFVIVNGAPNFMEPHRVADGASELIVSLSVVGRSRELLIDFNHNLVVTKGVNNRQQRGVFFWSPLP
jgi:hypothetical protein